MNTDILVVLSRKDQPELVCAVLAHHGISATIAENVQNAILSMEAHTNAFLLLDYDLEGADSFIGRITNNNTDPPPYLLAADTFSDASARAQALNSGVDACLEKPVDAQEVLALINAVLRRAERQALTHAPLQPVAIIEYGDLSIDPLRRTVNMSGEQVSLTAKEFDILHLLASYPGIVFTKSHIYERVWKDEFKFSAASVPDHISSVRQKLGLKARDGRYIETVFGVGYRFVAE